MYICWFQPPNLPLPGVPRDSHELVFPLCGSASLLCTGSSVPPLYIPQRSGVVCLSFCVSLTSLSVTISRSVHSGEWPYFILFVAESYSTVCVYRILSQCSDFNLSLFLLSCVQTSLHLLFPHPGLRLWLLSSSRSHFLSLPFLSKSGRTPPPTRNTGSLPWAPGAAHMLQPACCPPQGEPTPLLCHLPPRLCVPSFSFWPPRCQPLSRHC